jgi:hypothetical protein
MKGWNRDATCRIGWSWVGWMCPASVRGSSLLPFLGTFSAPKLHSYGRYFTLQFQRAGPFEADRDCSVTDWRGVFVPIMCIWRA